jgi:RHS repeat-associated protein
MLPNPRLLPSTRISSFLAFVPLLLALFGGVAAASAQVSTSGVGVVRHGLTLDGSNRIEGSLQVLTGEPISLIGTPVISADLLVPGTPTIQFTGNPYYGGTLQGTGSAQPSNYVISGDGHFSIRRIVTRSNPVAMPVVAPPPLPTGTRDVTLSSAGSNPGSFATIRNLTVGGNAGNVTVPPGTYGFFSVSGKNSLTLGVPGATQPAVYNFQRLVFSGDDDLRIVGPVIVTVDSGVTCGGRVGSSPNPSWLKLRLAKGDLVFSGNNTFYGEVVVPNGAVHFNGNSELIGGLACDRLVLDGNNLLRFLVLNTPPAASSQSVPTDEDTPVAIVLGATDAENTPLTYTLLSQPTHGTLSGTAPNFIYTPAPDDYGPDSFTFKVSDGQADSNVATVDITVAPVNDAPQADGQERTTEEDVDLPLSLTGRDVEGDSLTYRIVSYPTHGSFEGVPPTLTYRPAPNFNGHDEFTFVVKDGTVDSAPATVTIEVGPVNDAPEGTNAPAATDEDIPVSIVVAGTDPDGDSLTFQSVALPSHGVLSGTGPNFTYTPSLNYHGSDEFTFRANDGWEDSGVATISIEVRPINDQPSAAEQNLITAEDAELPLLLEGNDVDGDQLAYIVVLPPAHGALTGTPPNLTYVPAADYNGPDSFTFKTNDGQVDSAVATVGITVTPRNDKPTATGQELVTNEETALPITLSGIDIDGDPVTFTIVESPQHGVLSGTPPHVIYTPAADFRGHDTFTFVTNDGEFSSEPAVVALTVTPVNDPPSIDASAPAQVTAPETIGLQAVVNDDGDPPGTALTVRWSKVSGQGDIFFSDETQSDTTASYSKPGSYVLRATVSDGEFTATDDVEVTVLMPNRPPEVSAGADQTTSLTAAANLLGSVQDDGLPAGAAVTQQWSKVSGPGTVTFGNASALATSASFNAPGDYVLRLRASDSELTGQAQMTVHVLAPNQPPQVTAGPGQTLPPGESTASLAGSATDDGLPRGPGLQTQWSKVSGPGETTFGNVYSTATSATFSEPGTYLLRLSATDGELSASADTQVVVVPRPNQAPVVNAGADQLLSGIGSAALQGSITDDGLPAGSALTQQWTKVSGPGEVSFGSASTLQTNVSFSAPGIYVLRLTGSDTAFSASDEVTIEARFQNAAPIVSAGEDRTVTLPAPATLAGIVTDDGLPGNALTIAWTQVSGPDAADFGNAASARTSASFSVPGVYVLRLTGNDSEKSASDEVTITVAASPFQSRTFTVNADFDEGQSANVNHSVADQLQLSEQAQPFNFIWVANSTKGTIVKINTETGAILGEYWSSPTGQPRNPSRTTVDLNGSVWATNRDGNSVLQVALAETGQCIDRNGNGTIDTSTGFNDIRPWTNANNADTNGGVSTAADECIVHYTRVSSSGTRHVSVNSDNDVWVSGTGGQKFDLIDGDTGLIKRSEPSVGYGGYGGLIDKNGVIWSARPLLRWDTSKPLTGPNGQNWTGFGHDSYGLGIDPDGNVWNTALEGNQIRKWAPDGTLLGTYQHGFHWAQGCAADKKGNVWVAHSINGGGTTIGHLKTNGTYVGNILVGAGPTGVAVDAKGKIWAASFDGTCSRIDPDAGPLGADGVTRVGAVDFRTVNLGGQLYNYSDMTGSTLTGKPLSGTWTVVHDSGLVGAQWGVSDWNALLCGDAGLTITAASSNDGIAFSASQPVIRGAALPVPAGRYLKLQVVLKRSSAGESPVLYDLSVGTIGYAPASAVNHAPSISAGNAQDIAWPATAQLQGSVCDDGLPNSGVRTGQWSKISGPGTVTFGNAQALKTTAAFSEPGVYILRLDGSDSALSDFATVRITANPVNTAPAVSAGPDQSAANAGDSVALRGWVGDDGLPNTSAVTAQWSVLQGPGTVTFADASMADTTAVFSAAGIYVLKLTANDSALITSDLVEVRVGVPCAVEAPSGVVGWWPGNGDPRNLISGVAGIPVGGLTYGPGAVALGFQFDGSNDFLQVPASPALNVGPGDGMTIEFWINPTNRDRWQPVIEWNNGSTWGAHVWVEGNSQGGRMFVNLLDSNGGNHTFTSEPNLLFSNQWQHVAFTYSKATGQLRVYRNGQLFQQAGMGVFSPRTSYDLYFGRRPGDANHFGGLLDEVTIYNRALESELYPIATAGVAGKCQPGNNAHPFVDAGPDQTTPVTGAPVALNGLVSDDGLPAGAPVRSSWSLVAGPGLVTFADATQPVTTASFSQPGIYLLRLSADDTLASASDLVEVHVAEPCSVPAPSGLRAWWTGNGHARDLVAGNNGQLLSGTTFAPGKVSLGLKFDGVNDVVRVPAAPNLDIGAGDAMTVEFWINPDNRNRWQSLVEWHNGATWGAHIHIEGNSQGGRLFINLLDTNGGNHTFTSNPDFLRVGEFQHVAVTYDKISGLLRIWRNGERFQEAFMGRFNVRTTYDVYFGRRPGDTNYFGGVLDEIAFYNRALDAEITDIYRAGQIGKCPVDANAAPVVNAGADLTLGQTGVALALTGSATDDGLPAGSALATHWSLVNGPGSVDFADASALVTTATFSAPGIYLLQLAADDSAKLTTDLVEVRVAESCSVPAPSGLKAWWSGNGHSRDLVAENNGQFLSGTTFAPGKVSLGWKFDGVNDVVRVPAGPNLDVGTGAGFTVEFWINPDNRDRSQPLVEWNNGTTWGGHIWIDGTQGGRLWVNLVDINGGNHTFRSNPDFLRAGEFQHIAVTYDKTSGMLRIWRNGERFQEAAMGSFAPRTSYDLYFGHRPGDVNYFGGVLDEISLYNRALTFELQQIYAAGRVGKCSPSANAAPFVDAGPDQTVAQAGAAIPLDGYVHDDGLPTGSTVRAQWSVLDGPGGVTFGDANSVATTASFSVPGLYILQLAADDTAATSVDTVEVRVAQACQTPVTGMVAWWPGNGDGRDVVKGFDAELISGTTVAPAKVALGFKLDGANDFARIPQAPELNVGAGNGFSFELWIKPTSIAAQQPVVEWNNGSAFGVHMWISTFGQGTLFINIVDSGGGSHFFNSPGGVITAGTFQHVAATYNKATGLAVLYRNGQVVAQQNLGIFTPRTNFDLYFGHRPGEPSRFGGMLDEVTLYNRALTAAEIAAIAAADSAGKCPPVGNEAPYVDAGLAQQLVLGSPAALNAVVHDDGRPDGSSLALTWSQVSGPAQAVFASPNAAGTSVNLPAIGVYVLRLTATDGVLTSSDDVSIAVTSGVGNLPPSVNAGGAQTIRLPATATLEGSASDDGVPAPLVTRWRVITGPGSVTFGNAETPATTATFSAAGNYLLRLTADDSQFKVSADVAITVHPASPDNHAPVVNAGPDEPVYIDQPASVSGAVTDDGLPTGQGITVSWTQVSGPGAASFTAPTSLTSAVQFSVPGAYVLRLSASDSDASASDEVTFNVYPALNVAPSVNAGADQQVSISDGASLQGIVTDDGLPIGGAVSIRWSKVSGPGVVTFASESAATTQAQFSERGAYLLALTADDSEKRTTDQVMIVVGSAHNQPPTADAGPDQTIPYGQSVTLAGTANDDGLPNGGIMIRWSLLSGPAAPQFSGTVDALTVSFPQVGTYALRFTADDGEFTASDDIIITVAPSATQPPLVALTAPAQNAVFNAGQTITLTATTSDSDGTVQVVEFYADGQLLGTVAPEANGSTHYHWNGAGLGAHILSAVATDNSGTAATSASVNISVQAPRPTVSLTYPASFSAFAPGEPVQLHATASAASGAGTISSVEFLVNGAVIGSDSEGPYATAWTTPGAEGEYTLTARATDATGQTATSAPVFIRVAANPNEPLFVELDPEQAGMIVTAPTVLLGTVSGPTLASWIVEYRQTGIECTDWITLATGTQNVAGGLATLDTTLLLNGAYDVRLTARNASGGGVSTQANFIVDGNMKVGNFTATFKDLELPLSGVPITVTRTYDSRKHCPGDFGFGWTLDVDTIRLESTEQMGDAWSLFIYVGTPFDPSYYRLDDAGPHLVSLKMPGGQLLRFTPKLVMDRPYNRLASLLDDDGDDIGQVYAPIQDDQPIKMIYRARPGAEGAVLKARGYRTASVFGGLGTVSGDTPLYLADTFEGAISLATRPGEFGEAPAITGVTGWELTLRDGRVFLFDAEGKLEEMRDRVGNKVAFNRQSTGKIERITHTPSGKEIVFTRDGANRIKSITDPAGNAVQYRYTTNGDLDAVFDRGNDPANNAPTTTFTYKGVTHLLEDIFDARGIRAAKNFYDDDGRLYKMIDAEGRETIFTHDLNSRTETIKDRAGNITVHKYDERGNVIETRAPDGTVTATGYHRWSDGTLSELKETESVTGLFTNEVNPTGPLVTKTVTTNYSYEDDDPATPPANDGLLRKLVNPKGETTTFNYDERGNVLSVTDARANAAGGTPAASVVNTYNGNGLLETATDALGNVTIYTYDAKGNPDKETRAVTLINADGTSSLVSVVTDRDYNALGQLEKVTDPTGHATTYEYDANGNRRFERTTRTSAGATIPVVTETEYDEQDRPVRTWNADNPRAQATRPSRQTVYDGNGKVEWTFDALGRGTRQEYDSRGLAFKTTHPDNTFETVSYDAEGRHEISTDRRGKATRTVYDAMGRVSETIFLGGAGDTALTLSSTRYDAAGRAWQSTDANNNTTSYGYDDAGRRTTVVAPAVPAAGGGTVMPTTRYSYDPNGNLRFVTNPKGVVTEHVYDGLNRRRQTILPPAALDLNGDGIIGSGEQAVVSSTSTGYDELGRRVSETDASNRTKRYGYDVLGRLRHVIDYAGQATRFEYDELGNQLSQTDANNHITHYTYDNAGRRVTRTLPLGQQELLGYDDAGNLKTRRDFNGRTTTFQYDAMNRLRFRIPDASLAEPAIEFTYNDNGQRQTMGDASGTTVYGYDGRGQLRTKQTPFGTLNYDYYPNGSLKQMWSSHANGINVSYGYDALNRLQTVGDAHAGPTSYGYDANGNLEKVLYANGVSHAYGYNALNRLTGLNVSGASAALASFAYAATPAGQRTSVSEGNGRTAGYGYDNLGRLQRETITGSPDGKNGLATYGYDNVGNRLSRTSSLPGVTNQSFGYDWNDRLNGDQYDNNGNTKTAPVSQPTTLNSQQVLGTDQYDGENRLVQRIGTNGASVTLIYDGDGNRVQEIVNGQIKNYLVDDRNPTGYAQVVEEIVGGVVNHTYTYGHDLISQDQFDSITMSWRASFYGYDGRGTVRFLTDETGSVTDTYTYDAFGTLITATGSTNNRYLYSGEQFDPNLGLYYLRARLMNPLTGRFWTQDTYEGSQTDPISLHKYLYANTDPTNGSDPSGRMTVQEAFYIGAIIAMRAAPTVLKYSAYTMFVSASVYFLTGALIDIEDAYFGGAPEYLHTFRAASGEVLFIASSVYQAACGIAPPNFRDPVRVPIKKIYVSPTKYPKSAQHIQEAQNAGKPAIVRAKRDGSVERRRDALQNTKTMKGQDRDEYPPAMFEEGGTGASVKYVPPSDNRGAGASIGRQMSPVNDGEYVEIVVGEPPM